MVEFSWPRHTKLAITKSASDKVNDSNQQDKYCGCNPMANVIRKNKETGFATSIHCRFFTTFHHRVINVIAATTATYAKQKVVDGQIKRHRRIRDLPANQRLPSLRRANNSENVDSFWHHRGGRHRNSHQWFSTKIWPTTQNKSSLPCPSIDAASR